MGGCLSVDDYTEPYMRSLAMVSQDGTVFWPPIVRFRSSCKVDITFFPFDDQVCHMKMGSWAYDGFQVDIVNNSDTVDLSNYIDNGEWQLLSSRAVRNVKYYSCCPEPFPDVTFWFHLRRRTTYYTFNIIIPCVILSILTLACFILPADSGEKVTLGLTVLLAFSVFMLLIAENMPATSEFVPLIGLYLTVIMAMTSMSVIFSVFVLHIHHKGGRGNRAPLWLRRLTLRYFSKILCVRISNFFRWNDNMDDLRAKIRPGFSTINQGFRSLHQSPSGHTPKQTGVYRMENGQLHVKLNCQESSCCHFEKLTLRYQQTEKELLKYVHSVLEKQDRDELERHVIREWEDIAAVVDRFLFWIFTLLTLFSSLALLVFKPLAKGVLTH